MPATRPQSGSPPNGQNPCSGVSCYPTPVAHDEGPDRWSGPSGTARKDGSEPPCDYLISDVIWKIGRYSATIMPPTTTPRNAISSGSIRAVSDSVVDFTSWS